MKVARVVVRLADEERFHLEEGATTIMLKFLPPKLSRAGETLLRTIDEVAPCKYDLFYSPRSRHRKARNIDMCFINFLDHESAVVAGEHLVKVFEASWVAVRQAGVQGFLPNIAYYVTKSGYDALFQDNAPKIFQSGEQQTVADAFGSGLISQEKIWVAVQALEPQKARQEAENQAQGIEWEVKIRKVPSLQYQGVRGDGDDPVDRAQTSLDRRGSSDSGVSASFRGMELKESSWQDIRVGSIDEFGLHLSHILEHCEQVVVSV